MTIYIAICDDNIADRKQLERLLSREKDKRLKDNYDVLYIDSFGSEEALMHTPVKYDLFFIDMTQNDNNGMTLAKNLRRRGIVAPIVLCASSINYSSYVNAPKEMIFLEKPLNAGQISHLVDVAFERTKSKTPLIELRGQKDTWFSPYTDIIQVIPKGKFLAEVSLSDGSYFQVIDSVQTVGRLLAPYDCFCLCGKSIVNVLHIKSLDANGFYLSNSDYVKFYFTQKNDIMNTLVKTLTSVNPLNSAKNKDSIH